MIFLLNDSPVFAFCRRIWVLFVGDEREDLWEAGARLPRKQNWGYKGSLARLDDCLSIHCQFPGHLLSGSTAPSKAPETHNTPSMRNFTTVNYYFQTVLVVVVMLKFFGLLTLTLFLQNLQNERRWWTSLFCVGFRVWNECYICSYVVCDFGPCASGVEWCRKLSNMHLFS